MCGGGGQTSISGYKVGSTELIENMVVRESPDTMEEPQASWEPSHNWALIEQSRNQPSRPKEQGDVLQTPHESHAETKTQMREMR